jgi:hypothetical protein
MLEAKDPLAGLIWTVAHTVVGGLAGVALGLVVGFLSGDMWMAIVIMGILGFGLGFAVAYLKASKWTPSRELILIVAVLIGVVIMALDVNVWRHLEGAAVLMDLTFLVVWIIALMNWYYNATDSE